MFIGTLLLFRFFGLGMMIDVPILLAHICVSRSRGDVGHGSQGPIADRAVEGADNDLHFALENDDCGV
ncbi:MAG: hypothetical protein A2900_05560 [Candidatus Chisholmbacteria bacterium RIFCSPLOWO2_01_FULL_50_28]|uniref:Uncharacterized protein n=1 Tax=Candidatus Chisholmbacteria bacterium RIFCSPHIGHO2_01_FULL_52_32 TaxID=1797591 RepID=A0A1G1VRU0_9BACT|nr:MAG: hypothetical protein A2786_01185 [Candidatus Chisholmbacteria bacterium RIFCSPHIGHO2_01_FULL_52_32]OGY20511.1 MAG: hypothetical protein A2900_05560 [Candidatus Chisholmbacteria bacterium RIFCSPLOWO2_01_FULL_50_28]